MKNKFINIVLVQPFGYIHSLALLEVAEYFKYKLEALGFEAALVKNRFDSDNLNLILGAHLLDATDCLPRQTIIFNSEQAGQDNQWTKNEKYLNLLRNHYVWDYSGVNLDALHPPHSSLVAIGYEPRLERIARDVPKEFDLLFYGSLNARRIQIIEQLIARGLKVKTITNLYAAERDHYIARSRAVLNLHFYESQIFQQARVFYPLINGVPVISEDYSNTHTPSIFQDVVFRPEGADFVEYVVATLQDRQRFEQEACSRSEKFKKTHYDPAIEQAIGAAIRHFSSSNPEAPSTHPFSKKIHLGSGKDYRAGYLNIDIRKSVMPDLVLDLSRQLTLPSVHPGTRGQAIPLSEGQFDEIVANDVLEHVPDLEQLMTNCLSLLAEGGKMRISVPYDLSLGAWQDPTHVRGFNQNSWLYYTDWFWYLGWFEHKFDLTELNFIPSASGKILASNNTPVDAILGTPRAIDSMAVTLTKRKTTLEERTQARSFSGCIEKI